MKKPLRHERNSATWRSPPWAGCSGPGRVPMCPSRAGWHPLDVLQCVPFYALGSRGAGRADRGFGFGHLDLNPSSAGCQRRGVGEFSSPRPPAPWPLGPDSASVTAAQQGRPSPASHPVTRKADTSALGAPPGSAAALGSGTSSQGPLDVRAQALTKLTSPSTFHPSPRPLDLSMQSHN